MFKGWIVTITGKSLNLKGKKNRAKLTLLNKFCPGIKMVVSYLNSLSELKIH